MAVKYENVYTVNIIAGFGQFDDWSDGEFGQFGQFGRPGQIIQHFGGFRWSKVIQSGKDDHTAEPIGIQFVIFCG